MERGDDAECHRESVLVKGRLVVNEGPARDGVVTLDILASENTDIKRRLTRLERALVTSPSMSQQDEASEFKEDRLAGAMEEVALGIGENQRWKGASMLINPDVTSAGRDQWYHSVPLQACVATIPPRARCRAVFSFFAEQLEWLVCCYHIPALMRQHEEFWEHFERGQADDTLWLAILFSVLSFSAYFSEESQAVAMGFNPGEVVNLAKIWFDCAIAIMFRNDCMSHPSLAACQVIQTLMYPFHLSGNTGLHTAMSVLCLRNARSINLHLLGSGSGKENERFTRDVGRRVWWNIVEGDWMFLPYQRYSGSS
jgi:hypothetical protein